MDLFPHRLPYGTDGASHRKDPIALVCLSTGNLTAMSAGLVSLPT